MSIEKSIPQYPTGASAIQFGFIIKGHKKSTPEQLEIPLLEGLYAFRFEGVEAQINDGWEGKLRLPSVPVSVMRAWLRVSPEEVGAAADRLQALGYIERRPGRMSLPFTTQAINHTKDNATQVTREIQLNHPDGSLVSISYTTDGKCDTVIAQAGKRVGTTRQSIDPCPILIEVRPSGQTLCLSITGAGIKRFENF